MAEGKEGDIFGLSESVYSSPGDPDTVLFV